MFSKSRQNDQKYSMIEELLQEAEQFKSAGNEKQAALIYEQAIKICENDPHQVVQLALCLQELATIYSENKLYDKVIPLYQRLVTIGAKILGAEHPDVSLTLLSLARALEANKQYSQADEIYQLAASRAERTLGLAHPLAQEIRQEYFKILSNREDVQEDSVKLGLFPLPASKSESGPPSVPSTTTGASPQGKKKTAPPVRKVSNQPKKIKNLRYGAESAEQEARHPFNIHTLDRRWPTIIYIISAIIGIAAIAISLSQLFISTDLPDPNVTAEHLIEKGIYQSVDGLSGVHFIDNKYALMIGDVHHRKIPYYVLRGNLGDLWATFLSTIVPKENWYQLQLDELISEDGSVLYAGGASEFVLVEKIKLLAEFAKRYYANHSCYPDKTEKLAAEPKLTYINPFDSKAVLPVIKRVNGSFGRDTLFMGLNADASVNACYRFLKQGGNWHDEVVNLPGRINALALFTTQRCADGYKVNEFYIHGFDRHGKLISSGEPYTAYLIGLYGGKDLEDENKVRLKAMEHASVHPPNRIYVIPGCITDLQFAHQFGANFLGLCAIFSLIIWIFLGLRKRRAQPRMPMQPVDWLFLLTSMCWAISTFIHMLS